MRQFTARHIPHRQTLTTHPCIKANALKGGLRQAGHFFGRTKVRPYKQDAPKQQQNINENHTNVNVGTHLGASENKRNTPQQQPNINGNHANVNVGTHLGASAYTRTTGESDAPRCVPTNRCYSMRYQCHDKRVLITLQSGANHTAISTCLQGNQHPFAERAFLFCRQGCAICVFFCTFAPA